MIKRDELIKYINSLFGEELLADARQKDELANGVQFLGAENVSKVTLGVSLNAEWLTSASESDSNFCIFHHGFDPRTYKSAFSTSAQERLRIIVQNNLTVLGYHYCLDAHPEFGNNAVILAALGAKQKSSLFDEWGFVGSLKKPRTAEALAEECSNLFGHDVLAIYTGAQKISTIGVVSGAAKPHDAEIWEIQQKGVQLFISGETSESTPHRMKESGINYFVCGHYATEVFGIQALGKLIKDHFGDKIEVEFIDIPNPV
jgi:dinuclear metal center YbgI/SA1388 family protein